MAAGAITQDGGGISIIAASGDATPAAFSIHTAGRYFLGLVLSGGTTPSVILSRLGPDGSTYVAVPDIEGSVAGLSASGGQVFDLPGGDYKFVVSGAPTVVIELTRINRYQS
jgi:hypothetical protein